MNKFRESHVGSRFQIPVFFQKYIYIIQINMYIVILEI